MSLTDDRLRVPVLSGLRLGAGEGPCYVIGCNMAYPDFRDLLTNAAVRPVNPSS